MANFAVKLPGGVASASFCFLFCDVSACTANDWVQSNECGCVWFVVSEKKRERDKQPRSEGVFVFGLYIDQVAFALVLNMCSSSIGSAIA